MKKIFYIVLALLGVTSCNRDFLTETPSSSLPLQIAITDSEGLEKGVIGIYTAFEGEHVNDMFNFSELITDNGLLSNANNGQYSEIYNMNYSPLTSKINRFWNGWNDLVIKANWVLSYEGKLKAKDEDEEQVLKNLYSEAKILRAFGRLKLAEFFCARLGGNNQELGLPINNDFNALDYSQTYARSTVPQTYSAIESDLLYAVANMDQEPGRPGARNIRVGPLAASLLLSRTYLFERKWDKAIEYSNAAQEKSDALNIQETTANFPFPPQSDVNGSSVFQFDINPSNDPQINSLFNYWTAVGDSNYRQFFATKEFYDMIPAADSRKRIYSVFNSSSDTPNLLYIVRKFGGNNTNDPIFLRKAEIAFNKIEATYYSNPLMARTDLVAWMKANRYASYTTTATGTGVLDEILKQRRIEFAFEGFRFMDLKRNDLGWTKGANYQGNQKTVAAGDRVTVLPIPNTEIISNPKMVQYPGYN